jgi:hypothetical protein
MNGTGRNSGLFAQELKKLLCYSKPSRQEEEVSNKKIQTRLYFVVPAHVIFLQSLHYFLTCSGIFKKNLSLAGLCSAKPAKV